MPENGIVEIDRDSDFKLLKPDPKFFKMMETAINQNSKILDTNIKIINYCLVAMSAVAVIKTTNKVVVK